MKFVKLVSKEQLDAVKVGDVLLVQWKPGAMESRRFGGLTHNNVQDIVHIPPMEGQEGYTEITLNSRINSYFNVEMYIQGTSFASEVYLVQR